MVPYVRGPSSPDGRKAALGVECRQRAVQSMASGRANLAEVEGTPLLHICLGPVSSGAGACQR